MCLRRAILCGVIFLLSVFSIQANYTKIHDFMPICADGGAPIGALVGDGTYLYGVTRNGGAYLCGTVFRIHPDGSGYSILHSFKGGSDDGQNPSGGLTLFGSTLYGTTSYGGDFDRGTIFSLPVDGSQFRLIYEFTNIKDEGSHPCGPLVVTPNCIFGAAYEGAYLKTGHIFRMNLDGTGFTKLCFFEYNEAPYGGMILNGDLLIGFVREFGSYSGRVFSVKTDGSELKTIYNFDPKDEAGYYSYESPLIVGGRVFCSITNNYSSDYGKVISFNLDGSDPRVLHVFQYSERSTLGSYPRGGLVYANGRLYGATRSGGSNFRGMIYSLNLDGSDIQGVFSLPEICNGHTWLYAQEGFLFAQKSDPEIEPYGGIVFRVNPDGSQYQLLHAFDGSYAGMIQPFGQIARSGELIFGLAVNGSSQRCVIYKKDLNNGTIDAIHEFSGNNSAPQGIFLYNSRLFGLKYIGSSQQVLFSIGVDGNNYQDVYTFPENLVVIPEFAFSADRIYGATSGGGVDGVGTLFSVKTDGTDYKTITSFLRQYPNAYEPACGPILVDSMLYGVTRQGGGQYYGVLYCVSSTLTNSSGVTALYNFGSLDDNAVYPSSAPTYHDGWLYGVVGKSPALIGQPANPGIIYAYKLGLSPEYKILHRFGGADSNFTQNPVGGLRRVGSRLFGQAEYQENNEKGILYSINLDGSGFQILHAFGADSNDGLFPTGSLQYDGNHFYGITSYGGISNWGTIFSFAVPQTLNLYTPNGGERWYTGNTQTITWSWSNLAGNVVLELLKNAQMVGTIAEVPVTQGSYQWSVGQYQGGQVTPDNGFQIRIRSTDNGNLAPFSLAPKRGE